MITTTFTVAGMDTPDDAQAVRNRLANVSGIGGIATEIRPSGEAVVILKHKEDVRLDRGAIATALREAGDYRLG
jgi:copper chaperone CopZ